MRAFLAGLAIALVVGAAVAVGLAYIELETAGVESTANVRL